MKVTITNWTKYNDRPDRRNYVWLRLENNFLQDNAVYELSDRGKILYIALLCEASKKSGGEVDVNLRRLSNLSNCDFREKHLEELIKSNLVARSSAADAGGCPATDATYVRTNIHTTPAAELDLEKIYQEYPKRPNQRKAVGMKRLAREVKTSDDYQRIEIAVRSYAAHCIQSGTPPQFIKQFATWCGEWQEWVDSPKMPSIFDSLEDLSS